MNWETGIVLLILAVILFFAIRSLIKNKKNGNSCCGSCSNCHNCHKKQN